MPSLDLNLVVVLHALLQERNVTRAGERVGLSQPGASAALARLRRHFDDPLLERVGTIYELTPLAQALRSQVAETVANLQLVLSARPGFDPKRAEREFTIQCSDSVLYLLGPALVRAVTAAAPAVTLDLQPVDPRFLFDPPAAVRDVDVLILPRGLFTSTTEIDGADLYEDRWVCVTSQGNHAVGNTLTKAEVAAARWVVSFRRPPLTSPIDAALAALGIDRRSTVKIQSLTMLHRMVAGTDLLVLAHEMVVGDLTAQGLRRVELPVVLPSIREAAWSHPSHRLDPGHRWLLAMIRQASLEVRRPSTSPSPDALATVPPAY
nr:LysR family transcriptional regulator [Planosporangium mesophilum]